MWRVGLVAVALQLVGLLAFSVHLWQRFDLGPDFATFAQAFSRIGQGHLDPYLSTFAYDYPSYGYPFWRSHLELAMWPLALLWAVTRTSLTLLVVQDVALAAAGVVALRWCLELLDARWPAGRGQRAAGAVTLVVLLADPWTYWTAGYDFHFEALAAFFAVAAGRDLWQGRRRALVWVALLLTCGDVAATYAIALGIGGLAAGRRARPLAGAAIGAGVAFIVLVAAIGSGRGSTLAQSYGYLAGHPVGTGVSGAASIAVGGLGHPHRAWAVLRPRLGQVAKFPAAAGWVGLLSAVGLPVALVVLGANALNVSPAFVAANAAFQDLVAVLALVVGAAATLAWLAARGRAGRVVAALAGLAVLASSLDTTARHLPDLRRQVLVVGAPTAAALAAVERATPAGDEVVASEGVVGRFGARQWVVPLFYVFGDGQTVPVRTREVVVVLTTAGMSSPNAAQIAAATTYMRGLGATQLVSTAGVTAWRWQAPAGAATLHFPLP